MVPPKDEERFVQLNPGNISYLGPTDLMKYSIKNFYFKVIINQQLTFHKLFMTFFQFMKMENTGSLVFEIVLGRQILSEALTAILPTLIIVIVSETFSSFQRIIH